MFLEQILCQRLDTCMHRIACFAAFFALVAHATLGCCAHHAHADERGGTQALQAACCCGHEQRASAGAELAVSSSDSHGEPAAGHHHGEPGHKECHESPCVYVAPNKALAAGGVLCCAVALPIVVDDTSFLAKPALADALPTCELLLAPRSHFLNQTLLL